MTLQDLVEELRIINRQLISQEKRLNEIYRAVVPQYEKPAIPIALVGELHDN